MIKEIIICIVIISSIVAGNTVTQNYSKTTIENLENDLNELRIEISNENVNKEVATEKMERVDNNWGAIQGKLAYYIEHDEIEKVETDIVTMRSFIETEQYEESISELDKTIFVLKHIEDKYEFNLKNIF